MAHARTYAALVFLFVAARFVPGALFRDVVGPPLLGLLLAALMSHHLSGAVSGWPRVPFRTWARAWLRCLGVFAAALVPALVVSGLVLRWEIALGSLRFCSLALFGALAVAALGRLFAPRPPEPPPAPTPSAG